MPTSLYHSQTSLVSAQQCDGCLDVHLAVQHSPYCSDPHLAVQTFIWLFKHSFGCSNIYLAVEAFRLAVQVAAHYELLQELAITVPPMEFAAFKTMEGDVLLMQDAVYSAEANKELYIQRFKVTH